MSEGKDPGEDAGRQDPCCLCCIDAIQLKSICVPPLEHQPIRCSNDKHNNPEECWRDYGLGNLLHDTCGGFRVRETRIVLCIDSRGGAFWTVATSLRFHGLPLMVLTSFNSSRDCHMFHMSGVPSAASESTDSAQLRKGSWLDNTWTEQEAKCQHWQQRSLTQRAGRDGWR